jgi:hypothetical protein
MFSLRGRDPFGCHGISCVKVPAAVAFPADERLLKRIEESRRALPLNNIKTLRTTRSSAAVPPAPEVCAEAAPKPKIAVVSANVERLPARGGWTLPHRLHVEDVYARSRIAAAQ